MINKNQIDELLNIGATVVGSDGEKIGKFGQVFIDDRTGEPQWGTVRTGLFGLSESFVPLDEATVQGDSVAVPFDKQTVKDAPRIDDEDGHLSPQDEAELYRYYNRAYDAPQPEGLDEDRLVGGVEPQHQDDQLGTDGLHPTRSFDNEASAADRGEGEGLTRSEEQLHVGTENVETGRAKLRKYVVTEDITTTVPVSHEEVRLEREPITDADAAGGVRGGELVEDEQEVTLHAERPVVEKEAVPVEKVRLDTETVTEEERVTEQVRKEQIEAEGDVDASNLDEDRRSRGTGI